MEPMKKPSYESQHDETMNSEHEQGYSLEDAIEAIGFGKFHVLLTLAAGILWASDSMENAINAILPPTLVCEWQLTSVQEAMMTTVHCIGHGIGSIGWGYLSDMYGRKAILRASALTVFVFGVASSQVPSYWSMLVCRCLVGLGVGGIPQTVAILTEVMPVQPRSKSVLVMKTFCGIGSLAAAGLAIAVINALGWRYFLLILASPLIVFLIGTWWMPESPRYLLITEQMDKLNALIKRIAKVNRKEVAEVVPLEVKAPVRGRILDLFTEKFRATTVLLLFIWFTTSFCTHGMALLTAQMFQSKIDGCQPHISMNVTNRFEKCRKLTNADYTDFMITSGAEIPALVILLFVIDRLGRKLCLTIEYGLGFISIMALLFCSTRHVVVALIFIFRGVLSSAFATIFLYTAEVFPTNVRSVGLGCCSMVARLGSIVTPFVAQVLIHHSFYSVIGVYAGTLVLAVVASLLLKKETNQAPLEDSSAVSTETTTAGDYQTFESDM